MPSFDVVGWDGPVKKLYDKKKNKEQLLLDLELKALDPALETMEKNHRTWAAAVDKFKLTIKEMIAEMDKAIELIESDPSRDGADKLVTELESKTLRIGSYKEILRKTNEEYAAAFAGDGFRANKLNNAPTSAGYFKGGVMSVEDFDKTLGRQGTARREKVITADTQLGAERQRIEEYEARAQILVKRARDAVAKGKLKTKDLKIEFGKAKLTIEAALRDGAKGVEDRLSSLTDKLDRLFKYAANEKLGRETTEKQISSTSSTFENDRKAISGSLKTIDLTLAALEKRFGSESYSKADLRDLKERAFAAKEKLVEQTQRLSSFDRDIEEALNKTYG